MGLTIGSLFSGIGGLELGLEWAGLGPVVWQVEKDEYCRRVLAKHWPDATRYEDVRDVGRANLVPVDVICGGFPCQDISVAGSGPVIVESDHDFWIEFARIVRELRPDTSSWRTSQHSLLGGLETFSETLAATRV
jgi:DNA (cytosine-5)-methyltransferase 1